MNSHVSYIYTRWGDLDMLGHINNVAYATYFETSRVALLREAGGSDIDPALSCVVVQANFSYRASATHPSELKVDTTIVRLGNTSMVFRQVLQDRHSDTVYSEAEVTLVWIDIESGKPMPIPDYIHRWIEGDPGAAQ